MTPITLTIDDREIQAIEGRNLLQTCLENGIVVPNLCFLEDMSDPPASCRLCFVEIAGEPQPLPSCKVQVRAGMVVKTDTDTVRRLQRAALRLLLSAHRADCRTCPANRKCALQNLARFLGVRLRPRRLEHLERDVPDPMEHPLYTFIPSRCVLCGRCVYVCRSRTNSGLLTFIKRGFDTLIGSLPEDEFALQSCSQCHACEAACPVAALFIKDRDSEDDGNDTTGQGRTIDKDRP
jgi:bidirectional [NiFe] hydrogenase diaphorase subunit